MKTGESRGSYNWARRGYTEERDRLIAARDNRLAGIERGRLAVIRGQRGQTVTDANERARVWKTEIVDAYAALLSELRAGYTTKRKGEIDRHAAP